MTKTKEQCKEAINLFVTKRIQINEQQFSEKDFSKLGKMYVDYFNACISEVVKNGNKIKEMC